EGEDAETKSYHREPEQAQQADAQREDAAYHGADEDATGKGRAGEAVELGGCVEVACEEEDVERVERATTKTGNNDRHQQHDEDAVAKEKAEAFSEIACHASPLGKILPMRGGGRLDGEDGEERDDERERVDQQCPLNAEGEEQWGGEWRANNGGKGQGHLAEAARLGLMRLVYDVGDKGAARRIEELGADGGKEDDGVDSAELR